MSLPLAYVIEDDEVIANIFSTAVRQAEFETVIIRDGVDAMEKLEANVPDLVILDLHLPGISGINILRLIRGDARFKKTRVLIASADATQSEFLRVNADEVLIKPIGFLKMREVASQYRPE
jgi:two-component system, OmpR family, response regulator AdeR